MIEGKDITWIFYFFLIWHLISSIHMQTNILNYIYAHYRFWGKRYLLKDKEVEFIVIKKTESEKLFAGLKIIFTILIITKFATIITIKQWADYYNYSTKGCVLHISDSILLNFNIVKIGIFLGFDILLDLLCLFYHKKTKFANIIYYIPNRSYKLQGMAFYFPVFLFEVMIQKIWYIY